MTEPTASGITLVHAATKIILAHLPSQGPWQVQVINNMRLSGAGGLPKEKLFLLQRRTA